MRGRTRWYEAHKRKLVEAFGGACQRCGYNRCMRALQFHHKDEETKKEWSSAGKVNPAEVEQHPEHFLLLCANCHFEEHDQIDRARRVYANCLHCGKEFWMCPKRREQEGKDKYCSRQCQHAKRFIDTYDSAEERFWKYVDKQNDCWIWTAYILKTTPILNIRNDAGEHRPVSARRLAYEIAHKQPAPKNNIRVTCGNFACVNPAHFAIGKSKKKRRGDAQPTLFV